MKRPLLIAVTALGIAALGGCADDYHGRVGSTWSTYSYGGWYDNYYGPFHDGYWGLDGLFWFRLRPEDKSFRRDERNHFRRDNSGPDPRYQRFERQMPEPPRGARMPSFPRRPRGN